MSVSWDLWGLHNNSSRWQDDHWQFLLSLSLNSTFNPKGCGHRSFQHSQCLLPGPVWCDRYLRRGRMSRVRQAICSWGCPPCMLSVPTQASDQWAQRESIYLAGRGPTLTWRMAPEQEEGREMCNLKWPLPLNALQPLPLYFLPTLMPAEVLEHPSKEHIYWFTYL